MAKNDKVTIHISNDVGPAQVFTIEALTNGAKIRIVEPRASDRMYDVQVMSKVGTVLEKHSFAKDHVIAIIDGRKDILE